MWRMRIALWKTKDTDTHSEYVILIAFPLQKLLQERVSIFRHTHIACLVVIVVNSALTGDNQTRVAKLLNAR
jgi:hypothetical protein